MSFNAVLLIVRKLAKNLALTTLVADRQLLTRGGLLQIVAALSVPMLCDSDTFNAALRTTQILLENSPKNMQARASGCCGRFSVAV